MNGKNNNIDDFFDISDDGITEEINITNEFNISQEEINVKQMKQNKQHKENKVKNKTKENKNKEPKNKKTNKLLKIEVAIALVILAIVFVPKFTITGIKSTGESVIEGHTISEVSTMLFEVKNKGFRDVSNETIWFVNDNEYIKHTNSTTVQVAWFKWGENSIIAKNGADTVEYKVVLQKGLSETDELHSKLSMMFDYPDICFMKYNKYEKLDSETLNNMVFNYSDTVRYNDGFMKTIQETKGVLLETTEKLGYSLELSEPIRLSKNYLNRMSIEVTGDWENVKEAALTFSLGDTLSESVNVYKYKDGKEEMIDKSTITYLNSKISFPITDSAIYFLRDSNELQLDNTELFNNYNIDIINISTNSRILMNEKQSTETEQTVPTEQAEQTIDVSEQEKMNECINSYTDIINTLIDEAKDISQFKVKLSEIVYTTNTFAIVGSNNSNTQKCNEKSVEVILSENIEKRLAGCYQNKSILIIDAKNANESQLDDVNKLLLRFVAYYTNFDTSIFIITDNKYDVKDRFDESLNIKYIKEKDEIKQYSKQVNATMKSGKALDITYKQNNNLIKAKAYNIIDSGFEFGKDNMNKNCTFNNEIQASNSFGQCLLNKLVYEKSLNGEMFKTGNCLNSNIDEFKDTMKLEPSRAGSSITDTDISKIYEEGLYSTSINTDGLVDMLSLSQLNSFDENLVNLQLFEDNSCSSFAITEIYKRMTDGSTLLANIKCGYGNETILITGISQDSLDLNKFYIHFYNPMESDKECIGILTANRGLYDDIKIGYYYDFYYEDSIGIFNEISLVNKIVIYNGDIRYSEMF